MSAIKRRQASRAVRDDDPRVVRTRAAVVDAARTLFMRHGYAGTTMDDIATRAGITKRTLYNNYADKEALFRLVIEDVIGVADSFARSLDLAFWSGITSSDVRRSLEGLAQRLALAIVRAEVIALRRLLVRESRDFPALAAEYFDRAPGQVIDSLTTGFALLGKRRLLRISAARTAAEQFAYLIAGAPLDRAMLVGAIPSSQAIVEGAREGVETFLARYAGART